jgi:hypothetical protein
VAFAAERALELVGHSALSAEDANRDLPVSMPFLFRRNVHDVIQTTVSIGGTGFLVKPLISIYLDGSLW